MRWIWARLLGRAVEPCGVGPDVASDRRRLLTRMALGVGAVATLAACDVGEDDDEDDDD